MTKAMFKWINRWVICEICIKIFDEKIKDFLKNVLLQEHILSLTLAKVLSYNMVEMWFIWKNIDFEIDFSDFENSTKSPE